MVSPLRENWFLYGQEKNQALPFQAIPSIKKLAQTAAQSPGRGTIPGRQEHCGGRLTSNHAKETPLKSVNTFPSQNSCPAYSVTEQSLSAFLSHSGKPNFFFSSMPFPALFPQHSGLRPSSTAHSPTIHLPPMAALHAGSIQMIFPPPPLLHDYPPDSCWDLVLPWPGFFFSFKL